MNINDKKLAGLLAKAVKQADVCVWGLPDGEIKKQIQESRSSNFETIFKLGFNLSLDYKLIVRK